MRKISFPTDHLRFQSNLGQAMFLHPQLAFIGTGNRLSWKYALHMTNGINIYCTFPRWRIAYVSLYIAIEQNIDHHQKLKRTCSNPVIQTYSLKWYCFKEKFNLHRKCNKNLHKTNTTVIAILFDINKPNTYSLEQLFVNRLLFVCYLFFSWPALPALAMQASWNINNMHK